MKSITLTLAMGHTSERPWDHIGKRPWLVEFTWRNKKHELIYLAHHLSYCILEGLEFIGAPMADVRPGHGYFKNPHIGKKVRITKKYSGNELPNNMNRVPNNHFILARTQQEVRLLWVKKWKDIGLPDLTNAYRICGYSMPSFVYPDDTLVHMFLEPDEVAIVEMKVL